MKNFIKLMSVIMVLGVVATASDLGGNPEAFVETVNKNPIDLSGQHCDSLERLLGMCRSSQGFIQENS